MVNPTETTGSTAPPPPLAGLPTERPAGCPLDPPAEFAQLRAEEPLCPMAYPDGHVGWLATSHALVREVLADSRFSSRAELVHWPIPGPAAEHQAPPAEPGMFVRMDAPEHTRYRKPLAGKFTTRRMRRLTERLEQIAADRLDAMERQGPTVDLFQIYAMPIPAQMMCELLGVPYEDREFFERQVIATNDNSHGPEAQFAAFAEIQKFLNELVLAKRANPTDDVLSELTDSDLTDEELTNIGSLLLGAGFDTTANMIGLSVYALLTNPDQLAALRAEPELADGAVEELLRYLTITDTGMRTALEDVELAGRVVKAGDTVTLAVQAANRDPEKYPDPDVLDIRRQAAGQLTFGHGIHQCLGQHLARVEVRIALVELFNRFPGLRLAVPAEEVPMRSDSDFHGVVSLPVTW
ncbi:cytochrome P450 [Streptomyces venezuelae]|uniref:Cytochrome P450 n=1 Tax=Streptomyces venezuelae TaxID=54571 RepID=A0A5P2CW07_STRVZ|nr:cytochrome P450 [Streptomyces venezuelae]QES47084.1 cytochrome P450 [Streptomyces venezuelae]